MHDVIVIGVGSMGAAAVEWLSRRGARVLGLDQFSIPHNRGSHHGKSRMFRMAYYEHPDYVPLLKRAYEGWKALESKSRQKLFHEVGALYIGREDGELLSGSIESAKRHAIPHEEIPNSELQNRYPQFRVPTDHLGFFESQAGFVFPELAIETITSLAVKHGATVLTDQRVVDWSASDGRVHVRTETATHEARALIITAGAWTSRLVQELGGMLSVTRQVLGWVRPANPSVFSFAESRFPCWAIDRKGCSLHYGFPMMPGDESLKLALHSIGPHTDPDRLDRSVAAAEEAEFREVLGNLPDAAGPTVKTCVCMYTNSPDGHFIIDRHADHANVFFACGFSGHGFKFAPVIGQALADLALAGRTDLPIDFLSLKRFNA